MLPQSNHVSFTLFQALHVITFHLGYKGNERGVDATDINIIGAKIF